MEKVFNVDKLKELLNTADEYNKQSLLIKSVYDDISSGKCCCPVNLVAYDGSNRTCIAINTEIVRELIKIIRERYRELIRESKQEVDKLYEEFLDEKAHEEEIPVPFPRNPWNE